MTESCQFTNSKAASSAQIQGLKCAVITPVGPGHQALAVQARASVSAAFHTNPGPFTEVFFVPMLDLNGEHGRSQRRNDGIDYALSHDIDWIFFLDADDILALDAFASVADYVRDTDAIFGLIAECAFAEKTGQVTLRSNQLTATTSLIDVLRYDPFLTLQMGHFVRTKAASAIRFDANMNTGEDFKYYLELWRQFRCRKIDCALFINRRGAHSSGPRAADGADWRESVSKVFEEFSLRHNLNLSFPWAGKTVRFAAGNPMDLIHRHFFAGTFFEAEELAYLQKIVPPHSTIVEVGANVGNHLVYYGLFMQPDKILPIEPNPAAIDLLKKNIELNQILNVDMSLLGFGIGDKYGKFAISVPTSSNVGAARLIESSQGSIEVYPLDEKLKSKVDFIKIDVEWMELEALRGATELINDSQPIIFIEIMNANIDAFLAWAEAQSYRIIKTFEYVNAKNFIAVPSSHILACSANL